MTIFDEISEERKRQDAIFGVQIHPDGTGSDEQIAAADRARKEADLAVSEGRITWEHILKEEVFEAFAESDVKKLRYELLQSAAVCLAWCQAIDRREQK